MKLGIVLGTRPEIIKLSSIIRYLQNQQTIERFIIHTNQHYSANMDTIFFEELELQPPAYNLGINGGTHGEMTGRMLIGIEKVLVAENPDIIFVQGDTNTVLAGGLAASKLGIKVGHVEAGLRSYDRTMPEEINRVVVDHIGDYLFVPTEKQQHILIQEGIEAHKIFVTGNTVVDAVHQCLEIATKQEEKILGTYGLQKDAFILVTSHRPANVDDTIALTNVLTGISEVKKLSGKNIVFPIHPRTKNNCAKFGLTDLLKGFTVIDPVGFIENLVLESNAALIVTDSGGIQEEACILQKKTLILRENTERPETLEVGGALLVGNNTQKIIAGYTTLHDKHIDWYNPFGDGKAGEKIIDIVKNI